MNIASLSFICLLVPTALIYYILPFSFWKKIIILIINILFYLSFNITDIQYLFFIILYSYLGGLIVEKKKNVFWLLISVLPVFFGLMFYKYTSFFLSLFHISLASSADILSLAVPVGLSFYTFKAIGYLFDVSKGRMNAEKSIINYAIYISFFPQILSGPIQKAREFIPQINKNKKFNYILARHGFLLTFFGFFEKMVIAERLNVIVQHCFEDLNLLTPSIALIGTFAYSFQLYCDFDAYSNIAIGIGELFGYQCEKNFDAPYFSGNIKEFWNRWHISLSSWFKEYIYYLLGGSRKGLLHKYINLIAVFLVSGLWHGASLNFLVWGLIHGLLRVLYDVLDKLLFKKIRKVKLLSILFKPISVIVNFSIVSLLWIIFRFSDFEQIKVIFTTLSMFDYHSFIFAVPSILSSELIATALILILFIFVELLRYNGFTIYSFSRILFPFRWCLYFVMIIMIILFAVYGPGYDASKFIYLQF